MTFSSEDESEEEKEIKDEIQRYKSSFLLKRDLEERQIYNKDKIKYKLETFVEELNCGYEDEEEYIRSENCVSFLYWMLGKTKVAFEYCEKVLQRDNENLIALVNKTYFLLSTNEINKSRQVFNTLKELRVTKKFERLETTATAEIAYLYSRFGPRFQVKAIEYFREALMRCPTKDLWKFGLGLTLRRQSHVINTDELTKENIKAKSEEAAELFFDICTNNNGKSSVRAKAYCELGNLLCSLHSLHIDGEDTRKLNLKTKMKPEKCFQEALLLRPNDVFVLEKCGQQYRYLSKQPKFKSNRSFWLSKSKELLERSLNIRETTFAYHHLGLTLEAIAKDEINTVKSQKKNLGANFGTPQCGSSNTNFERNFERQGRVNNELMENIQRSLSDLTVNQCPPCNKRKTSLENSVGNDVEVPLLCSDSGYDSAKFDSRFKRTEGGSSPNSVWNAPVRGSSEGRYHHRSKFDHHHNSHSRNFNSTGVFQENPSYRQPVWYGHSQRNKSADFRWNRSKRTNNNFNQRRQYAPRQDHSFACDKYTDINRRIDRTNNNPVPKDTSSTERHALRSCVKSPKKLQTSPGNLLFLKAIQHIEKAIEIQKGLFALGFYDIGMLYRELEEDEKAIDSFNEITKEGEVRQHASPLTIINSYEQQGIIKLQKAEKETDAEKMVELTCDGKRLLQKAVKLSAKNIMKFSLLRCAWEAFPTLTDLLHSEGKQINCKELGKLHELVGLHSEAIKLYREVYQSKDSSEETKKQALQSIVDIYVQEDDFDSAEVYLDCLRCTGEANDIPIKLYFETYLRGAMHAARQNDRGNMTSRFNSAFKVCLPSTRDDSELHDGNDECDCYDVLLLKTHDDDDSNIRGILTNMCGLNVTVDTEYCPYGARELNYITAMQKQCYCIFCILQGNTNDEKRKYFMDLAISKWPDKTFVVKNSNCHVPDKFGGLPTLQYPENIELDEATRWMEIFLCHCFKKEENRSPKENLMQASRGNTHSVQQI